MNGTDGWSGVRRKIVLCTRSTRPSLPNRLLDSTAGLVAQSPTVSRRETLIRDQRFNYCYSFLLLSYCLPPGTVPVFKVSIFAQVHVCENIIVHNRLGAIRHDSFRIRIVKVRERKTIAEDERCNNNIRRHTIGRSDVVIVITRMYIVVHTLCTLNTRTDAISTLVCDAL